LFAWMDEGFNTFINSLSAKDFNKGEYDDPAPNMHFMSEVMTNPEMEPIFTAPDGMKEANLGILAYYKPGSGLTMLREQILGEARFDKAFRTYVERWAYKHPQPDDFFRTIENVAGEDLNWFWRGWIINNWRLDQGVVKVKYVKGDAKNGAFITVENLEKMPMPLVVELKTKSGTTSRVKLPVEIWQRNVDWTFKTETTEELESVTIDPDNAFPDVNSKNNIWTNAKDGVEKGIVLDGYLGNYSSPRIPIKVTFKQEDESLVMSSTGQQDLPLENAGNNKFTFEQAGLSVQFNDAKDAFTITFNGQSFDFTKDK